MLRSFRVSVLILAAACRPPSPSPEPDVGIDHVHERIVRLRADDDGDTWVTFERSARLFVILRADAPLLAFAQQALADQRPVHATVRTSHGPKSPTAVARPVDAAGKQRIAVVALEYEPESATTPQGR